MTLAGTIGLSLRSATARLLDSVLPPRCISCEAPVDGQGKLCPDCWSHVRFIDRPMCATCGLPFNSTKVTARCVGLVRRKTRHTAEPDR